MLLVEVEADSILVGSFNVAASFEAVGALLGITVLPGLVLVFSL